MTLAIHKKVFYLSLSVYFVAMETLSCFIIRQVKIGRFPCQDFLEFIFKEILFFYIILSKYDWLSGLHKG